MAKYHSNSIILTAKENKYIQDKLNLIESPLEWIEVAKEAFALANFELQINFNPSFKLYTYYSNVIPCFYGSIAGRNVDLEDTHREVYSLSIHSNTTKSFNNILRINTGSGGGGGIWSYDYAYLDIRLFPAMQAKYTSELVEAAIKQERHTFQTEFDTTIKELICKVDSFLNQDYNPKVQRIDHTIKDLEKLQKQLLQLKNTTIAKLAKDAFEEANLVIPTTNNALDLSRYNRLMSLLNHPYYSDVHYETTMSEAEKTYNNFISNHPELYV